MGLDPVGRTDPTGKCTQIKDADGNVTGVAGICGSDPATAQFVQERLSDTNFSAAQLEAAAVANNRLIRVDFRDGDDSVVGGKVQHGRGATSGQDLSVISLDRQDLGVVEGQSRRLGFGGIDVDSGRRVTDGRMSLEEAAEHEFAHTADRIAGTDNGPAGERRAIDAENAYRARTGSTFRRGAHDDVRWVSQ